VGVLVVKTLIWSLSLGSGTSGGVLAPIFMIGGALGALEGLVFPDVFPGFWAMMGLAAVVGGVMRSPLTGVVFTLELTHAWSTVLPLLIAATSAYAVSALLLKRSVLTENIARRGLHLTREYSTDPLETFFATEVMDSRARMLPRGTAVSAVVPAQVAVRLPTDGPPTQRLFPVIDDAGTLLGVVTRRGLLDSAVRRPDATVGEIMIADPVTVYGNDTLRHIANVFAETGVTRAAVIARERPHQLLGVVALSDLLQARLHDLTEEHHRERQFTVARRLTLKGPVR